MLKYFLRHNYLFNKFNISYFSYSMEAKFKLNNKQDTLIYLKENNIPFEVEDHEKTDTVNEGLEKVKTDKLNQDQWTFAKNLFLKNKSGGFILLTAHSVFIINNHRQLTLISKFLLNYSKQSQVISDKLIKISSLLSLVLNKVQSHH